MALTTRDGVLAKAFAAAEKADETNTDFRIDLAEFYVELANAYARIAQAMESNTSFYS